MGLKTILTGSTLARYGCTIRASPRPLITNHRLMLSAALYATSGIPITWDQGSSSVVPTLPGFQRDFGITSSSSQAAIAMIFIHGFGYAIGLLVLPYVFGAEVWPNQLRSFGSALAQTFHWLFFFGISRGTPSILSSMDNWGAFLFFAGWCFVSLVYVYLVVPETAGQSLEEIDELFEGSWFMAWRSGKKKVKDIEVLDGHAPSIDSGTSPKTMSQSTKALDVSA